MTSTAELLSVSSFSKPTGPGHGSNPIGAAQTQKRNRTQLSCTHCRHSKLKCDRKDPCSQCIKKGRASLCTFPAPATHKKPSASMQNRLKHLESLVKGAMTGQNHAGQPTAPSDSSHFDNLTLSDGHIGDESVNESLASSKYDDAATPSSGQVVLGAHASTYVGATHWAAILDDIEEVKTYFNDDEDGEDDEDVMPFTKLAFNSSHMASPASKLDLLAALPERHVVDRLLSRYFNSNSPALHMFHRPTFQKKYQKFWVDPPATPIIWVGLLYAFMVLATFSTLSSGEENPDSRGTAMEMIQNYRNCCVQALALSNYTKPGPYTIETLIVYMEGEFMMAKDNQVQFYLLVGNTVRLALRMGLHRDATKVSSNISPFQAEMRRRTWNHLIQIDLLSSFHIGLPGMFQGIDSDTLLPSNLRDEDFGRDSTALPQSRPDTELTTVSYSIFKGRLCKISGKIASLANRLTLPTYTETMKLDKLLHQAYGMVPHPFQLQLSELSILDSSELMIKRFSLALIYQKSRCMLHRKFMMKDESPEYAYSNEAGLDASMQLLRYQAMLHEAALPGGPLSRDRWFLSSLSMHDFLLAAMIVYLAVIRTTISPAIGTPLLSQKQKEMVSALNLSCAIWNQTQNPPPDVKKASEALGVTLKKMDLDPNLILESNNEDLRNGTFQPQSGANSVSRSSISDIGPLSYPASLENLSNQEVWPTGKLGNVMPPSDLEFSQDFGLMMPLESLGTMIEFPDDINWEAFDNHVRPPEIMDQTWPNFLSADFETSNDSYYGL